MTNLYVFISYTRSVLYGVAISNYTAYASNVAFFNEWIGLSYAFNGFYRFGHTPIKSIFIKGSSNSDNH